jgi:CHAT domain-containing protein/Tfp pilus assembly protein PilF
MSLPNHICGRFFALLLLAAAATCIGVSAMARAQTGAALLTAGATIKGKLAGGESQTYRVELSSGQYLRVVVEQQGIDVSVALIGPDQKRLVEMDSPNGNFGPEPITAVVEQPGAYTIEVRAPDTKAVPGLFELRVEALREPTPADRSRADAERGFIESSRALGQAATRTAAREKLEALLPIFRSLDDHAMEVSTLNRVGLVYNSSGQPQLALARFERALSLTREDGDRRGEARVLNNIGGANDILGEPQQALLHYRQALTLWETLGNDVARGDTLNNIGVIYYNLGELQLSLDYYQRALPLRQAGGDRRREADTLDNISLIYIALGEPQSALDNLKRSLEFRRTAKDVQGEANSLTQMGFAYISMGDAATALDYFNQALPLRRTAGDKRGEAVTLKNIGVAYATLAQPEKAIEQLDQGLAVVRAIRSPREEALVLVQLGQAQVLAGAIDKAVENYRQALGIFQTLTDRLGEARARQGIAEAEGARGNLVVARQEIESTIAIIEALRGRVTSQQLRTSFFASRQDAYEFQIDLLMRMHRSDPTKGYDVAALEVSEKARARSLLEMLAEFGVDVRQGVDPALLERERNLSQLLSTKASRLISLLGQPNRQEQAEALKKELGTLEGEFQEVRGTIRQSSPHYAAITQPLPLDLAAIQGSLDPDTLLLEYSLGAERSYLWAVSPGRVRSFELPGRKSIELAARRLYELVTARSGGNSPESVAVRRARIERTDQQTIEAAEKLSEVVLGPAASELKGKRLAIVADGALLYVPFAMLTIPNSDSPSPPTGRRGAVTSANYRPLIVEHEIVSLPSASTLVRQRKELAGRAPAPNNIALLADPVFDRTDPRVNAKPVGPDAPAPKIADDPSATRTLEHLSESAAGMLDQSRIRRLPYTRQEADRILAVAPNSINLRALDFNANLATAAGGELQKFRYVHFATHGFIDSEKPGLSALVLSLVDEHGAPKDGLLKTQEIYNLKLPAELVVLSACQTGLGKEIKGEGIVGLTRGFMYAGAARIIVSMWNVSDKGTADLMARLYRGMIVGGLRPTAALRAAQLELWKQKQWRSPYYWAAFVQQGEWR